MRIIDGGLDDPRVVALLDTHLAQARAETAPGSAHALDLSGLRSPDVAFWSAWEDDMPGNDMPAGGAPGGSATSGNPSAGAMLGGATLVGVGALRRLSADHGEVKSMHTAVAARGRGVGAALLRHIVAAARARGVTRLSLETGSWPYFAPARALYARHGFVECPPFGDYRPDPNSVFMTLTLPAR